MSDKVVREKGSAEVTVPCPTCGKHLRVIAIAEGMTQVAACGDCYPAAGAEKSALVEADKVIREFGSEQEEVEPDE